jgi:hypothetical protein
MKRDGREEKTGYILGHPNMVRRTPVAAPFLIAGRLLGARTPRSQGPSGGHQLPPAVDYLPA